MNIEDKKHSKQNWEKPQLIILVRSTPAESVLLACKYVGWEFGGPETGFNSCYWEMGCGACEEEVKS